jgi:hypothetical protein
MGHFMKIKLAHSKAKVDPKKTLIIPNLARVEKRQVFCEKKVNLK